MAYTESLGERVGPRALHKAGGRPAGATGRQQAWVEHTDLTVPVLGNKLQLINLSKFGRL